ncbi:3-demethylubiquinone-9 3-O-methyltransferase, partial [Yersinia pestis PY-02]
MSAVVAGFWPK